MSTNVTALISAARANRAAKIGTECPTTGRVRGVLTYGYAKEGEIEVRIIPVQGRATARDWSTRADVYRDGKRIKAADLKAILKAEAGA